MISWSLLSGCLYKAHFIYLPFKSWLIAQMYASFSITPYLCAFWLLIDVATVFTFDSCAQRKSDTVLRQYIRRDLIAGSLFSFFFFSWWVQMIRCYPQHKADNDKRPAEWESGHRCQREERLVEYNDPLKQQSGPHAAGTLLDLEIYCHLGTCISGRWKSALRQWPQEFRDNGRCRYIMLMSYTKNDQSALRLTYIQ